MINQYGHYFIDLRFGSNPITLDSTVIQELTITQNIYSFLPIFRLIFQDPDGLLTQVTPLDVSLSKIYMKVSTLEIDSIQNTNIYIFDVYRRFPDSARNYDISGLSVITNLFSPSYSRGFSGTISSTIETIGRELGITEFEISLSLNYPKTLIQPNWSNATFLLWLKDNLVGIDGEVCWFCFIKTYQGKNILVFKSLKDLVRSSPAHKFMVNDRATEDRKQAFGFKIYDNYKLLGAFATKQQDYGYFNYNTSEFVDSSVTTDQFPALASHFAIDGNDANNSLSINRLGRSNDFTSDFKGRVGSDYYNRLNNLTKIKLYVESVVNIVPGQIVDLTFSQGLVSSDVTLFQYSGNWLIEEVKHCYGGTHLVELFLMRNGVSTSAKTSLIRANTII